MSIKAITGSFLFSMLFMIGCQSGPSENSEENSGTEQDVSSESPQTEQAPPQQQGQPLQQQPPQPSAEDISDEEIETFAVAMKDVEAYGQEMQEKMMSALEEEGMDPQRFGQLQQAQQSPEQAGQISEEEMAKFQNAQAKVQEIQMGAQQEMEQKIQDAGMTVDRYREIMMAAQQNPELQQKISEI